MLERLIGAPEGQIRAQPVPENDRMTQRYRNEAATLQHAHPFAGDAGRVTRPPIRDRAGFDPAAAQRSDTATRRERRGSALPRESGKGRAPRTIRREDRILPGRGDWGSLNAGERVPRRDGLEKGIGDGETFSPGGGGSLGGSAQAAASIFASTLLAANQGSK
jgi:hypothetical protein